MKKQAIIILILALAVLAGAGFYFYQQLYGGKVGVLESIVPDDALTYIYARHPAQNLEDFQASDFFRQISATPLYAGAIKPKLDSLVAKLPFLAGLTEKEIALAIFSLAGPRSYRANNMDLGDFAFLARIDRRKFSALKKSLDDFYLSLAGKDKAGFDQYKGVRIAKFNLPKTDTTIRYCRLGDCLMITNSYPAVEKIIDLFRGQSKTSLANYAGFQKISGRVNRGGLLWGYTNNKLYSEAQMESLRQALGPDTDAQRQAALYPLTNITNIMDASAFSVEYDELKQGLVCKSYQAFNRQADKDNIMNVLVSQKPIDKDTFGIVPRDIVAYFGTNQDLPGRWKLLKGFLSALGNGYAGSRQARLSDAPESQSGSPQDFLKQAESFLGVNIEDELLPSLGNNFGASFVALEDEDIVLKAPPKEGNAAAKPGEQAAEPAKIGIVFPQAYLFVELKDAQAMRKVMEKLIKQVVENVNKQYAEQTKPLPAAAPPVAGAATPEITPSQTQTPAPAAQPKESLKIKADSYRGLEITAIEITDFPAEFIQPNYCIQGKYLIFSLSPRLTKKIIDLSMSKGVNFSSNMKMETLRGQLQPEYSNFGFFDPEALVNNLRNTRFYKESPFLNNIPGGKFNKNDLELILNILSDFQAVVFTTRMVEQDTAESYCYIKIKGL